MRNLKKFLALVLAMMMVFGLMVTANAADVDYSDLNTVSAEFDESVKVSTTLGVWRGRDDGNGNMTFSPSASIQRNEFATVLYRLATGDVNDEHLSDWAGKAVFNDVPADNWAAPYIAYAHTMGLMIGYNGNFSPTVNIDGHDAALALLRLLGYGKLNEYSGTDYKLNVAIDAATSGLSTVVGTRNLTGAATREIIAGLTYGALNSNKVYWSSNDGHYENEGRENQSTLGYIVFDMKVIHDGDRKPGTSNTYKLATDFDLDGDPFGRPVTYVVLVHDKVIYEGIPAPEATYNGNFTGKNAKTINTNAKTLTVVYNNREEDDSTAGDIYWGAAVTSGTGYGHDFSADIPLWHNDTTGIKGVEVEVYNDGNDNYTVVAMEAFLGYVKELEDEGDDITVVIYNLDGTVLEEVEIEDDEDEVADDPYDQLLPYQDRYIAVYPDASEDYESFIACVELDTVSAEVTRTDRDKTYKYSGTITAGGTTYSVSRAAVFTKNDGESFVGENNVLDATDGVQLTDSVLYLHNGTVLLVDQTDSEAANRSGYAYLYDVKNTNGVWTSEASIVDVRMYLADGSKVEVQAKNKTGTSPLGEFSGNDGAHKYGNGGTSSLGVLVYYTIDTKGVYTLTEIESSESTSGNLEILPNQATGKIPGDTSAKFDGSTVFFVVTTKTVNDKQTVDTVVTYKGIGNVPKLKDKTSNTFVAAAQNNNGNIVKAESGSIVTALMVEDPDAVSTTGNYFIVVNGSAKRIQETKDNTQLDYYEFNAIVDGQETKVKVDATYAMAHDGNESNANSLEGTVKHVKSVTVDEYGIITAYGDDLPEGDENNACAADATGGNILVNTTRKTITVGGETYTITDSLTVYLYTGSNVKKVSVSKVHTGDSATAQSHAYTVKDANGVKILTELYVKDWT